MTKKQPSSSSPENHIAVFQETAIRRTWHNEEWWFAIVDVVGVLTDSVQPEGYVKDLRRRDPELQPRLLFPRRHRRLVGDPRARPRRRPQAFRPVAG